MKHLLVGLNGKNIFSISISPPHSLSLEVSSTQSTLKDEDEILYHSKLKPNDTFTLEVLAEDDPRIESYKLWKGEGKKGDCLTCRN